MWKFSLICCFIAISTGIALNIISNTIQEKTKHLAKLEDQINNKVEKLHILETEWEFHTHPEKLMEVANNKLGMSSRKINQIGIIETVKLRRSAWASQLELSTEKLLKTSLKKNPKDVQ
jgi:hypothetical protein